MADASTCRVFHHIMVFPSDTVRTMKLLKKWHPDAGIVCESTERGCLFFLRQYCHEVFCIVPCLEFILLVSPKQVLTSHYYFY